MEDIYSLFMSSEPTAQQKAASMAAALRQRQQAVDANRGMGMVASLGQNNLLEGLGRSSMAAADSLSGEVQQGQQMLGQAGRQRAQDALQKQIAAERRRQELYDEASRRKWQEGRDTQRFGQELLQAQILSGQRNRERMELKEDARAAKAEEKDKLLYAPGYTRTSEGTIKPEEASGFRDAIASKDTLMDSLRAMRELYKEHGTEIAGDAAAQMDSQARDMLLQLKNLAKLGVLSQSDEKIINAIVPNPTSKSSNLKGLFGLDTSDTQLDELERQVEGKLAARARSLGYVPDRPSRSAVAPEVKTVGGKKVWQDPTTGKWFMED